MTYSSTWLRTGALAALAAATLTCAGNDAEARVFVGGGVILGAPYYAYPPYYGYPYYAYAPAPVYYAPPPAPVYSYVPPPPAPTDHYYTGADNSYCREYTHKVVVEGQTQQAYGHACRQQDGTWHIID